MIATELRSAVSTIRIHDEFCESAAEECISRLSRIVSESYKRRQVQSHSEKTVTPASSTTKLGKV